MTPEGSEQGLEIGRPILVISDPQTHQVQRLVRGAVQGTDQVPELLPVDPDLYVDPVTQALYRKAPDGPVSAPGGDPIGR